MIVPRPVVPVAFVRVHHAEPMVYFDHWAMRLFSDDANLAQRFIAALAARGGTLALSWVNLAEFATVDDPASVARTETFLDSILPRRLGTSCAS